MGLPLHWPGQHGPARTTSVMSTALAFYMSNGAVTIKKKLRSKRWLTDDKHSHIKTLSIHHRPTKLEDELAMFHKDFQRSGQQTTFIG